MEEHVIAEIARFTAWYNLRAALLHHAGCPGFLINRLTLSVSEGIAVLANGYIQDHQA
jgi:hypothetical protein